MRTLEEIAADPMAANISENLILVADPFRSYEQKYGPLHMEVVEEVQKALFFKFKQVKELLQKFRQLAQGGDTHYSAFKQYSAQNSLELLGLLLSRQPKQFEQELQRLWRAQQGKSELKWEDQDLVELSRYTHDYTHSVVRRNDLSGYVALANIDTSNLEINLRENPNVGYGNYKVLGWGQREKNKMSLVNKILLKILEGIAKCGDIDGFYRYAERECDGRIVTDICGGRVFWTEPLNRKRIEAYFFNERVQWSFNHFEDYNQKKDGRFRAFEYLATYLGEGLQTTEVLQLQVVQFHHLLLDDFFRYDNRVRKERAREKDFNKLLEDRRLRSEYVRMEQNIKSVL